MLAKIENIDGIPFQNGSGELEKGHIRTAPGTVDGKKAKPRGWDPKKVRIGMRHQFIGFFGRRIQADGVIHVVMD